VRAFDTIGIVCCADEANWATCPGSACNAESIVGCPQPESVILTLPVAEPSTLKVRAG
jgi:hypothetical protein